MTKRLLNGEELALATKMLNQRKEEAEWIEYQVLYHDLMLKTGLEMNYKKVVREFKQQKNEFEKDLIGVKDIINTLQHQIREGVEIIEMKVEQTINKVEQTETSERRED